MNKYTLKYKPTSHDDWRYFVSFCENNGHQLTGHDGEGLNPRVRFKSLDSVREFLDRLSDLDEAYPVAGSFTLTTDEPVAETIILKAVKK